MIGKTALSLIIVLFISNPGFATSFDCKKASQYVEKIACQNPELSLMDAYMGLLYQRLSDTVSPSVKQKLMSSQKEWLKGRERCKTDSCITNAYKQRLAALNQYEPHSLSLRLASLKGQWLANYSNQYAGSTLEITQVDNKGFNYKISANNGANMGEIENRANFIGNDAMTSDDTPISNDAFGTPCLLLFQRLNNQLVLTQNTSCSFFAGKGVYFAGTYAKDGKKRVLNLQEQGLLDTKEQEQAFKEMTGKDYALFVNNCGGLVSSEQSRKPIATVREAFLRGMASSMACIVMSNQQKFWAAVIDDEHSQIKYFSNDPASLKVLPPPIADWVKELEKVNDNKLVVTYGS